jgi:tetratricopeptide (TPR) repeat protein
MAMTGRFWLLPAAGILALALLARPASSAPVATTIFAAIDSALAAGDAGQALRLADEALNTPSLEATDRARLMLDRGLAHGLRGEGEDALVDITAAISARSLTSPEQARAYLERGLVLDGLNRLADAVGDYTEAVRLNPNSALALNNRANAYRRQNRFDDAKRDYLASLAAGNPAPEYPYYGLGQIAESQGKPGEAKGFYARAVAANPGYWLASERLTALGGSPPVNPPITLKPPPGVPPAPRSENAPIVLRPPSSRPSSPPARAPAPAPARSQPKPVTVAEEGPGLRPALDNKGGQEVQLGAWRQEEEAREGWRKAVTAAGGALAGLTPHIVAVDLPGRGRYYRLRVRTGDSKQLCAALTTRGMDCIPARN